MQCSPIGFEWSVDVTGFASLLKQWDFPDIKINTGKQLIFDLFDNSRMWNGSRTYGLFRWSGLVHGWPPLTLLAPHTHLPFRFNVALRPQKPSGLLGTGSQGRPPRPSHSSWALPHEPWLESILRLGRVKVTSNVPRFRGGAGQKTVNPAGRSRHRSEHTGQFCSWSMPIGHHNIILQSTVKLSPERVCLGQNAVNFTTWVNLSVLQLEYAYI